MPAGLQLQELLHEPEALAGLMERGGPMKKAIEHNIFTPGNYFYNGVGHVTVQYDKVLAMVDSSCRSCCTNQKLWQASWNVAAPCSGTLAQLAAICSNSCFLAESVQAAASFSASCAYLRLQRDH